MVGFREFSRLQICRGGEREREETTEMVETMGELAGFGPRGALCRGNDTVFRSVK